MSTREDNLSDCGCELNKLVTELAFRLDAIPHSLQEWIDSAQDNWQKAVSEGTAPTGNWNDVDDTVPPPPNISGDMTTER